MNKLTNIEVINWKDLQDEALKTREYESPRIFVVLNTDWKIEDWSQYFNIIDSGDSKWNGESFDNVYRIVVTTWKIDEKDIENYYDGLRKLGKYFRVMQLDTNNEYTINL